MKKKLFLEKCVYLRTINILVIYNRISVYYHNIQYNICSYCLIFDEK